jgi:Glycosyltransferase family 87
MWSRLASLVADRLVFAWLAGAAVWLGYLGSLGLGGWSHDAAGHRIGADHVQYYVVGQLVNEGDAALIYDQETMTRRQKEIGGEGWKGHLPFRYPPFYALAFAPTSRLSYEASFLVWTAIGFACLLLSGRLLGVEWRRWLLWSFCFYPVFAAFSFGQNGLISLAVLSGAAALWLRDRPLLAGLVLGLLAFKPHLALGVGLLWIFDVRHSWRALLGIFLTTAVLLLIGWLAIPSAYGAFFRSAGGNVSMLEQGRAGLAPLYSSQSFWQLLLSAQLDRLANPLALLTSVVGLVAFFLLWRRWRDRRATAFGLAVLVTTWLSPYVMVYDWTILLVAAVLLGRELPRDRWLVLCALLWLAALVGAPLVRGQLWLTERAFVPVALQFAFLAAVFAVLSLWNPAAWGVEQSRSTTSSPGTTPDRS